MEYCSKCFRKLCRCGKPKVEIDYYIYPAIYELNRKGYKTISCCSGHEDATYLSIYVSFDEDIVEDINSVYFRFDFYSYRGYHERRNCIRVKQEIVNKFKKKRTNKAELIQAANKDLYAWAKSLPTKVRLEDKGLDFSESYFDKEVEDDEIIDIQKPWMLFTKVAKGCSFTVDDFFNEIESDGELTEVLVNRTGSIKRFSDQDYVLNRTQSGRQNFLEGKIKFDISGDYKYLLCGYEPYVMIEKLFVENAVWYLSYARTDIAAEDEQEFTYIDGIDEDDESDDFEDVSYRKTVVNRKSCGLMVPLFEEDDVNDFFEEYPDKSELDLFACLFNRMCRLGINICAFSADNINIIFSNRTNISMLMNEEQNVFAFGEAHYEYMDFSHVEVEKKEVLVFANGRLLMRKEVA